MGGIIKILSTKPQNSDVFKEIETDFSAEIENSNVISAQNQVVSKKKRSSPKLRLIFRPKSLGLGWWGGMHPPPSPPKSATAPFGSRVQLPFSSFSVGLLPRYSGSMLITFFRFLTSEIVIA